MMIQKNKESFGAGNKSRTIDQDQIIKEYKNRKATFFCKAGHLQRSQTGE